MELATLVATVLLGGPSLVLSLVALNVARTALRNADRNASAAIVVTLNEAFAAGWRRFLTTKEAFWRAHEFAELLNTFEIAAGIHQDGALRGVAKELMEDYLCNALTIISGDADAKQRIIVLRESPNTFKYLIRFLAAMKRKGKTEGIETLIDMVPRWAT